MTYWEAAYILEHGSTDYGKIQEAGAIVLKVIKDLNKMLDEAEDAKFRGVPVKEPLCGTKLGAVIIDEFCGEGGYGMSRLDDAISDVAYILDTLNAYRNIIQSGNCNDCGNSKYCEYLPQCGEQVRINCPLYKKEVAK